MKILAIGWNYPQHNAELSATTPKEPVVFLKPDSSLLKNGKPFFIPDFSEEIEYETELVLRINRLGKHIAPKFASRYYDAIGLGIDFTARDLQRRQKEAGLPWEICKAFDSSAAIGDFLPLSSFNDLNNISFRLDKNGTTVQQGNSSQMIFNFDQIVSYVSRFFTLKIGDLIFTGTPAGVGKVEINDLLEGYIEDKKMFSFRIK
ncbi:MAG: fumarylacetoacetate hydrolase family protein [Paludibacteraceae bacterium]|nr:fumarylacetoacetate hydrolase family protein [Paludibacteraceae bacterium]MBO7315722.1 fumarylacetoacetate hydrolase family protein [Paludibacteraceae bacterium]